jgi:putative membrane protein
VNGHQSRPGWSPGSTADLDPDASTGPRSAIIGVGHRTGGIDLRGFVVGTIVTAIAFYIMVKVLPDYTGFDFVQYKGDLAGIVVISLIFGVVNGLIGPILRVLTLPISLMTLGLIGFVVNAALLLLTAGIADATGFTLTVGDFPPNLVSLTTLVAAVVGSIVLSLISSVIRLVIPD